MTVPFCEQVVPTEQNPLRRAEFILQSGGFLSGDELANLVEKSAGQPLPTWLTEYLAKHLKEQAKLPRGRRPGSQAALDFTYFRADRLYRRVLKRYQRRIREKKNTGRSRFRWPHENSNATASELAHKRVLKVMREDVRNIDWKALRNRLSRWRSGAFLHAEPGDGDEFADVISSNLIHSPCINP
jgi:hypothetical protein